MNKFIKNSLFIIVLILVVFVLRLPSLFEPYWYGDETIYLTIGKGLSNHMFLYRDLFDNKPPLIYILAMVAGGKIFWFRFILLVSCLFSIWLFWQLSNLMFNKQAAVKSSTLLFAVLTTIRLFEGNIPNAEIFILLPTIASLVLIWPYLAQKTKPRSSFVLIGAILGLGLMFKVTAVFDFAAILVFWLLLADSKKAINFNKKQLSFALGYFIPLLIACLYFLLKGILPFFIKSCFIQTLGYVSSWQAKSHVFSFASLFKTQLPAKLLLIALPVFLLWRNKYKITKTIGFVTIWLLMSLLAATLSQRPYPHYLMQTVPALCLLIGSLFDKKKPVILAVALFSLYFLIFVHYRFWYYQTFSYYQNFIAFVLRQKNKQSYFKYFDKQLPEIYRSSEIITSFTKPKDKMFIWGNQPAFYLLANTLPSTPYLVAYHISDLNKFSEVENDLYQNPPTIIVYQKNLTDFPALKSLINNQYFLVDNTGNYLIYRLIN